MGHTMIQSLGRVIDIKLVLRTDSEETVRTLVVQIWECGKAGSHSGTLDSDGPTHLEPLTEG